MTATEPPANHRTAGGAVWAETPAGVQVALVHHRHHNDWALPGGQIRAGETALAAACRVALEVTGTPPVVGPRLQSSRPTPEGTTTGSYWALHVPTRQFSPTRDIGRLAWFPLREARKRLSCEDQTVALDTLDRVALTVDTALLLVHHASIGHQSRWEADDRRRPLDEEGLDQAARLRRGLGVFAPTELRAVDNARCMGTLDPLADDLHLTVRSEPALSEDTYTTAPEQTLRRARELAHSRQRIAVCTHPTVIPPILTALTGGNSLTLDETREGSTWALFLETATSWRPTTTPPSPPDFPEILRRETEVCSF